MDARALASLACKLSHHVCPPLRACDIQSINQRLFVPAETRPEMVDFCLVLGSGRCEYRAQAALDGCGPGPHRFILSGGGCNGAGRTEARRMCDHLACRGVAADRILLEETSQHTRENLANTKRLLESLGLKGHQLEIILVTGGFHMRRTLLLLDEEWRGCPRWRVTPHSAYGRHTHPDRWHESSEGRQIIGEELVKLQGTG